MGVIEAIKRFDAYPKTLEDFRIKTLGGGTITVIAGIVMVLLFASEIRDYLTPSVDEQLYVDTTRGSKIKINLDIVFPKIGCDFLSLDAQDVTGEQQIAVEHNIFKRRLDLNTGKPIDEPEKHEIGEVEKVLNNTEAGELKCGSCYGAETEDRKCCNTCDEVKQQYMKRSWKFNPIGIDQCKGDVLTEEQQRALSEGCQVYGYLEVNRVGGSFHIAPGKSFSLNHIHVHDVQPFTTTDFNLTHTIRHLSFGRNVPGKTDPIDGVTSVAEKGSEMFQYYVKIVPTTFERSDRSTFVTNQFSVTRHNKAIINNLMGDTGMPGVFFSYELAPVMVKYQQKEKSFGHFASGLCAIIGGVFTVAGIIDKLIYKSAQILQQKTELGKSG